MRCFPRGSGPGPELHPGRSSGAQHLEPDTWSSDWLTARSFLSALSGCFMAGEPWAQDEPGSERARLRTLFVTSGTKLQFLL